MSNKPKILFEDTHIIVLSKPAGLLSQGDSSGDPHLVEWLQTYVGRNYVGLVHRLDRNTSGLMIVAKRSKAANRLTESLQKGLLERTYVAFVEGYTPEKAQLEHFLLKNEDTNEVRVVSAATKGAKRAKLSFRCFAHSQIQNKELSGLHVELETGRGHQIRVQCSEEGYPLIGDKKYGSKIPFERPALHSYTLKVPHPMTTELLSFKDTLPAELRRLLPKDTQWP